MRQCIMSAIELNVSVECSQELEIGNEGITRQLAGAFKDDLLYKPLRDALKVMGWTGWDIKRVMMGIDNMEEAMGDYITGYIDKFDLSGKKVPYEAINSSIAWRDATLASMFLLDDQRFKKLLKSVKDGQFLPLESESFIDMVGETLTAKEAIAIAKKEIVTFEDYSKFFSKACDNARTLIKAAVKENTGKLPKSFFANHYVGLNGLVAIAAQIRSSIRRAV